MEEMLLHPHFTKEETEAKEFKNLPTVTAVQGKD